MQVGNGRATAPPAIGARIEAGARAEQLLVRDALGQLGEAEPVRHAGVLARATGAIDVPVGTEVHVDRSEDAWLVVGSRDRELALARRTTDGTIERTSQPFVRAAEHTSSLLRSPIRLAGETWQPAVQAAEDGVRLLGRDAPLTMVQRDEALARMTDDTAPLPRRFETRWDDLLSVRGAEALRPVATAPSSPYHAIALRELVGDHRFVVSGMAKPYGGREALIGTDVVPGTAGPILRDATSMQEWFASTARVDVWPPNRPLLLNTDQQRYLVNASASLADGAAITNEGPRDLGVRETWLRELNGRSGQAARNINDLLREFDVGVRSHEAGHVAHMREWGTRWGHESTLPELVRAEEGVVQEAYADLFGAARSRQPSVGVRELGRLQNGAGTLERLRAGGAAAGTLEPHFGTQLVTRPMVGFADAHGWDAVAEVTGAATRAIGHELAEGTIDRVDIPGASSALHEAAAWRFGADAPAVQALREGWRQLGVPLRALR